jgi:transcriptional repressor NrdR
MQCPYCRYDSTKVLDTYQDNLGGVRRRRECERCHQRFNTQERAILAMPLISKTDGTVEDFNEGKLAQSIRIVCKNQPIPEATIEQITREIEHRIKEMKKPEIPSHLICEMVLEKLKTIDQLIYLRYTLLYVPFHSLEQLRSELDNLTIHK